MSFALIKSTPLPRRGTQWNRRRTWTWVWKLGQPTALTDKWNSKSFWCQISHDLVASCVRDTFCSQVHSICSKDAAACGRCPGQRRLALWTTVQNAFRTFFKAPRWMTTDSSFSEHGLDNVRVYLWSRLKQIAVALLLLYSEKIQKERQTDQASKQKKVWQ